MIWDLSRHGHLWRRILHFAFALVLVYYLVPPIMVRIGTVAITRDAVLLTLYLIAIGIEGTRLRMNRQWFLLHTYEVNRIASWFWFSSGAVLLIFTTPQQIAAPVITAVAFADPILGELRRFRRRYSIIVGFNICLVIFWLFQYPLVTNCIVSVTAVFAESFELDKHWGIRNELFEDHRPKRTWYMKLRALLSWDDDFVMQILPAVVLLLLFWLASMVGLLGLLPPSEPVLQPLYEYT